MSDAESQQHIWSHFQNEGAGYGFHASHARHAALLRYIARQTGGSRPALLNIGIGDGNLERSAHARGWSVSALDPDAEAIARLRDQGIAAQAGFIDKIPYDEGAFDFVVASEVLEHLMPEERQAGLAEVRRVLKPGGYFLGTVPYQEDLQLNVTVCPKCRHVFHRWGHTTSFSLASLRAELAPYLSDIACRRTAFVEFRGRSLSGKLKSLVRLFLAQRGAAIAVPSIFFSGRKRK